MKSVTVPLTVVGVYATVASFAFAAARTETILLYPNIFRDVPESLARLSRTGSRNGVTHGRVPVDHCGVVCTRDSRQPSAARTASKR